jgi:hypothetical protein
MWIRPVQAVGELKKKLTQNKILWGKWNPASILSLDLNHNISSSLGLQIALQISDAPTISYQFLKKQFHCSFFFGWIQTNITKCYKFIRGWLNKALLLSVLETGSPRSKCCKDWLLQSPLPFAYSGLSSPWVLNWSFLCIYFPDIHSFSSSSYNDTSLIWLQPRLSSHLA